MIRKKTQLKTVIKMNLRRGFGLFTLVSLVMFSCNRQASQLSKTVENNQLSYTYFSTKAKIQYTEGATDIQANLYLKMEHEKVVWASVSKLGKEAMRLNLTPDTTSFMNKYPAENRCYSIFPTQEYLKKIGVEGELKDLQDLFLGNQPFKVRRKDQVKQRSGKTILTQKRDSVTIVSKMNTISSKLAEVNVYSKNDTVSVFYSDYKEISGKLVPHKINFKLSVLKDGERTQSKVEINYLKPKFLEEALSLPFKIPSSYEECK